MSDADGQTMLAVGGLQNKAWAQDTSKFGFRMLSKMGWKAGAGLGKDAQGQAAHVTVKKRTALLGLGCSLKQAEVTGWSNISGGFVDVLSNLNATYAKTTKKSKKSKKKKSIEKVNETTNGVKRVLYAKRIQNKNAKGYSASDMSAILGVASSSVSDPFAAVAAMTTIPSSDDSDVSKKPRKKKSKKKSK